MTSMSVQCHYTYNSELHHLRMGEYRKTDDDQQACIIEFVLFYITGSAVRALMKPCNASKWLLRIVLRLHIMVTHC